MLLSFLILMLSSIPLYAESQETPTITFGGGVDYKSDCTQIRDDRSCDEQNMISDFLGTATKRSGSKRYISQAISTNPITSLYRAYQTSGTITKSALIATTWDGIYKSTLTLNPFWVKVASIHAENQHYNFVTMKNQVIITGDKLLNPIEQLDIINDSTPTLLTSYDGSTNSIALRAKYHLQSRNYYLAANCADVSNVGGSGVVLAYDTTYYPSRVYYSLLNQPSSMTVLRYIDVRTDDGEEITGINEMFNRVHVFKPSSIAEISFTALNLTSAGGDIVLNPIVQGFGLLAPRTLANTGQFYIFLAKDGIRMWDGSRRTRLTVTEESRVISTPIEPIIKDIVKYGTFKNCSGIYYPRKQWYIFSYEDKNKFPRGRANSCLIYDLVTGEWHPQKNWNAECFVVQDGITDNGELLYGDSVDGYVYIADREQSANDARKELSIDNCDSTSTANGTTIWIGSTNSYTTVVEGTASLRITFPPAVSQSSITLMRVLNLGEWPDKSRITKNDNLSFKVYTASPASISSITIALEIKSISAQFDTNFTSVTISSGDLLLASTGWIEVKIALSSFPILSEWVDLSSETFTFANTFTFYGLRFSIFSSTGLTLFLDDIRIVQGTENPLNSFRLSKQFNFGTSSNNRFRQVILNAEKAADSSFYIDIFNDFGQFSSRVLIPSDIEKELFVSGFNGIESITKLNSVDFSVIASTLSGGRSFDSVRPLVVDKDDIFGGDQFNNRLIKIHKSSMTNHVFVSTFGSFGSGTTNFNMIYQIAADNDNLYVCDLLNQRVKVHKKSNLAYVNSFGTLGKGTTSFHNPTGVAVDDNYLYVAQDGNYRIQKLTKSTGGYLSSIQINLNSIGDTTLAVDEKYLYSAYDVLSSTNLDYLDIILEKRNKSDLEVVNKMVIRPENNVFISSYNLMGDIGQSDDYIYISFTDDVNNNGNYFIQKRLKSDFSIVKEYKTARKQFAVAQNGIAFKPKRRDFYSDIGSDTSYVQFKYSETGLDNSMKLYNQAMLVISEKIREK